MDKSLEAPIYFSEGQSTNDPLAWLVGPSRPLPAACMPIQACPLGLLGLLSLLLTRAGARIRQLVIRALL